MSDAQMEEVPSISSERNDSAKPCISAPPETLSQEAPGRPDWQKPRKPWDTAYRSGEEIVETQNGAMQTQSKWRPGVLPSDIGAFNFATMGDGTRRAASAAERWKADYLAGPCVDLVFLPTFASDLHPVDVWWSSEIPAISPELAPSSKNI